MHKLQLISPAGDFLSLVAAVSNGADAVYLGAKLFNARRLAGNFNTDELKKAVQYAHLHGVKAYLALNTLVKNSEVGAFLNQASLASQYQVDAILLQDLTFAPIIKRHFPKMQIHASTQATIMNSTGVEYWKKYVDRFVLARELTKEEVQKIVETTSAKVEIFAHGHLCISYSGQCLISSLIGERSGNRGMCASSCRRQYNGERYFLSAKDLCMINNIQDVLESGATAIKIEGRMKSAEYVAATTKAYREQIDVLRSGKSHKISEEKINELKMAFNREFTPGYFNGEKKIVDPLYSSKRGVFLGTVRNRLLQLEQDLELHDGIGILEHGQRTGDFVRRIEVSGIAVAKARRGEKVKLFAGGFHDGAKVYLMTKNKGRDILGQKKKIPVSLNVSIMEGKTVECFLLVHDKKLAITLPTIATRPEKHPFASEQVQREFEKYNGDIFALDKIRVATDNSFVAKSAITQFRKELEEKLLDLLMPIEKQKEIIPLPRFTQGASTQNRIHARVYSLQGVREALAAGAEVIYYDAFAADLSQAISIVRSSTSQLYLYTPAVMTDRDLEQLKEIIVKVKPAGILANNVGILGLQLQQLQIPIVLGYQINIFNDQQLEFYGCPAVASIELNLKELAGFQNKEKLIFYAHGRPAVMTFKERFDANQLTDQKGYTFRLRKTSTGATEMLYSKTIGTLQHIPEVIKVAGISQFYLDLENDVFELVTLYKKLAAGEAISVKSFKKGVTIGNLKKGVT